MNRKEKIRVFELYSRLENRGFSFDECEALRRIGMTLSRRFEAECNGEIQRDESTGIPYRYPNPGMSNYRYKISDREAGAMRRLGKILANHPGWDAYIQGDPRGCSLYLYEHDSVPVCTSVESCYSSIGLAIY